MNRQPVLASEAAGLELRDTKVVTFGNPLAGHP
jgi:hypothetical protein